MHNDFINLEQKYLKLIENFAKISFHNAYNNKIIKANKQGSEFAKKAYEEAFLEYKKGFCIVLDERGTELDSTEFAGLLADKNELRFFIGGAYGLEKNFTQSFDFVLCLSKFTLAHSLAKIVLLEQIYRAFCIQKNHPYHK